MLMQMLMLPYFPHVLLHHAFRNRTIATTTKQQAHDLHLGAARLAQATDCSDAPAGLE